MNGRPAQPNAPAVGLVAIATGNVIPTGEFSIHLGLFAGEQREDAGREPMEISLCFEPVSGRESLVSGATDYDGAGLPANPTASASGSRQTSLSGSDGGLDESGEARQVQTVPALDALLP